MERKYTESRICFMDQLRQLCIDKGWYTNGSSSEYSAMLYKTTDPKTGAPVDMTTEVIADIAVDIYQHSEVSDYDETSIMYAISRICHCFFEQA